MDHRISPVVLELLHKYESVALVDESGLEWKFLRLCNELYIFISCAFLYRSSWSRESCDGYMGGSYDFCEFQKSENITFIQQSAICEIFTLTISQLTF